MKATFTMDVFLVQYGCLDWTWTMQEIFLAIWDLNCSALEPKTSVLPMGYAKGHKIQLFKY